MADRPLWADLTYDSSREEVLAAVAQTDRIAAELASTPAPDFGEVPAGTAGCRSSSDGRAVACFRPLVVPEVIRRQNAADEEDQSVPGWDYCP